MMIANAGVVYMIHVCESVVLLRMIPNNVSAYIITTLLLQISEMFLFQSYL